MCQPKTCGVYLGAKQRSSNQEKQDMLESKAVAGWRREGELKGLLRAKRDAIMKCVKIRFPDPGPELIRIAIEGTSNPDVLDRWLDAALRAASLPDLLNGREDGRQQGILET